MQKLEEVYSAEEAARGVVDRAREAAAETLRASERDARGLMERARSQAAEQAARLRADKLEDARVQAEAIAALAKDELETQQTGARARMSAAISAVMTKVLE